MESHSERVTHKLKDLIEKNVDAEKGYKKAAENVENTALKHFFENSSRERSRFVEELKEEVATYGDTIGREDSFTSKAHRAWMDIKAFLSGNEEEAILEEAIRGEEAALEEYDEVLEDTHFSAATRGILNAQRAKINSGLAQIRAMEHNA